jgi:hypothetical protein
VLCDLCDYVVVVPENPPRSMRPLHLNVVI